MLKHLEIANYALIEQLSIDFGTGLSVVTGETGAGKSIMMGALALVLGQRADTKVIQEGNRNVWSRPFLMSVATVWSRFLRV